MSWDPRDRAEIKERLEAQRLRREAEDAIEVAQNWKPAPLPKDTEEGYAPPGYAPRKGIRWQAPQDDEWSDGAELRWLHGEVS